MNMKRNQQLPHFDLFPSPLGSSITPGLTYYTGYHTKILLPLPVSWSLRIHTHTLAHACHHSPKLRTDHFPVNETPQRAPCVISSTKKTTEYKPRIGLPGVRMCVYRLRTWRSAKSSKEPIDDSSPWLEAGLYRCLGF